jgi:hypothetical protein
MNLMFAHSYVFASTILHAQCVASLLIIRLQGQIGSSSKSLPFGLTVETPQISMLLDLDGPESPGTFVAKMAGEDHEDALPTQLQSALPDERLFQLVCHLPHSLPNDVPNVRVGRNVCISLHRRKCNM